MNQKKIILQPQLDSPLDYNHFRRVIRYEIQFFILKICDNSKMRGHNEFKLTVAKRFKNTSFFDLFL